MKFQDVFKKITGHNPYPWQYRLYQSMINGKCPTQLDIPTGLGKTSIIVIWLIAKAVSITNVNIPSRLVYIVDRRVIVDQATTEAQDIANKIKDIQELQSVKSLSISKLRGGGGASDSREWLVHPENPAIVVGTIDMIGSRLLFSGYGLNDKMKSFYAGLLGQDSLIVLDEAHLSPAMTCSLKDMQKISLNGQQEIFYPPKILFMSATQQHTDESENVFKINEEDLKNPAVNKKYNAEKIIKIIETKEKLKKIFECTKKVNGKILIYLQKPRDVKEMTKMLRDDGQEVAMLTGTLRGYERDKLVKNDTWRSFLSEGGKDGTKFLVSTSAGEVGVDLDADHMICDMTTFDSLIQRLGRVNRSGGRSSKIFIIHEQTNLQKNNKISKPLAKTEKLLKSLTKNGTYNASPANISKIKTVQKEGTFAPEPEIQPLTTDILEMWALTSIHKQYTSLPSVSYWLRGKEEYNMPETYVAWRNDIVYIAESNPETIQNILESYRVLPHETARDYSSNVYNMLSKIQDSQSKSIIIKSNGECKSKKIADITEEEIRFATVLLPHNVGGLNSEGFIDSAGKNVEDVADDKEYQNRTRLIVEYDDDDHINHVMERIHNNKVNLDLAEWSNNNSQMHLVERFRKDNAEDEQSHIEIRYYVKRHEQQQSRSVQEEQLHVHHSAVEETSRKVTQSFTLPKSIKEAIIIASKFHDTGKARDHWQKCMRVEENKRPLAKTGNTKWPLNLGGFRHEFASVIDCMDEPEISEHAEKDLILHLIAAHHGWARPCFMPNAILHEANQARREKAEAVSVDTMRRYHKLQKRFGLWGLAWLEGLTRGSDWQASRNHSGVGNQK